MTARQYGTIGLVAVSIFVLANLALHILNPDLGIMQTGLGDYALGDYGWLSRAGDLAAAVGLIAISLGLRSTFDAGQTSHHNVGLIPVGGVGLSSRRCS